MKQITLYLDGTPVIHHPISHPPIRIGTDYGNDIVIASNRLKDCSISVEMDIEGKWFTQWQSKRGEIQKNRTTLEPGKKIEIGEFEMALTLPTTSSSLPTSTPLDGLTGNSAPIQHLRFQIRRIAPLGAPVLIEGESGTGKELTARGLHVLSKRPDGPFIAVNCGAIAESMAEDIFFGHEKGAFTGAGSTHKGVFERANQGTLFLDEIGELPLPLQASLLRVLDNGHITRIGSEQFHQVHFRLICATNRNLQQMILEKRFRLDLFHRISTLQIQTPPLRHRTQDIRLLAEHFLQEMREEVGERYLSKCAREKLRNHRWDGNCRQLRNVLYKAAALSLSNVLYAQDLELSGKTQKNARTLADECITEELTKMNGNVSATAKSLGIPRTSLRNRLRQITLS